MKKQDFKIFKAHGGKEIFSKEKLYLSLIRSGLDKDQAQSIADQVSNQIKEGCHTKEIYNYSSKLIKKKSPIAYVHYSLKKALFALGPEGHNFELFVAKYFETFGYKTKLKQFINGQLVKHEVDVVAKKDDFKILAECKFHNHAGAKNNIQVVLYVKARWDDIRNGPDGNNFNDFYLVSNTAFSSDAIQYADGVKLKILGINAPVERPFIEEIKTLCLYPVTSLGSLNHFMKNYLIKNQVILAKQIPDNIQLLKNLNLNNKAISRILAEVEFLTKCHP